MKKKLILVFIAMFIFMIAPNVEAKEYDLNEIGFEIMNESVNSTFIVEPQDSLIMELYDHINVQFNVYDCSDVIYNNCIQLEHYNAQDEIVPNPYIVQDYETMTGKKIPKGKKAIIECHVNFYNIHIMPSLSYYLVDDIQKEVVYHNTYDAENNNPTSYYEGETDILLNDISRDGYKFLGWYTSPNFEEDTRVTMISRDDPDVLNLYAKWEKIEVSEDIFTNPNTSSMFYIAIGIGFILILGTALVIVYNYKKL